MSATTDDEDRKKAPLRKVFSIYWYVKAEGVVFGPNWGDYTDINPAVHDHGSDPIVENRLGMYQPSDILEAKEILRSKGFKNVRAVKVTVYRKQRG
jgi:hypothetical protein